MPGNRPLLFVLFVCLSAVNCWSQSFPSFIAGGQEWMAYNLDVVVYWDGVPIPEAKTPADWRSFCEKKIGCYCNYDNEGNYSKMYGKLYNWYAIKRGVAPHCWRLPTKGDFDKLIAVIGQKDAAKKLKAQHSWNNDWNGTNTSKFGGLAAGCRNANGTFSFVGREAFWWTRDARKTGTNREGGVFFFINYDDNCNFDISEDFGFSVRCVRDVGGVYPQPCP